MAILVAVRQNGLAFEFTSDVVKNNKELSLAAVNQNRLALEYTRKRDKDIILAAIRQKPLSFQFASDFCHSNPDVMRSMATTLESYIVNM